MKDDFFDDNVNMTTLFHLLGDNQRPNLSNKEINDMCLKVLLNFNKIYLDQKNIDLFDQVCIKKYKINLTTVLNDSNIYLNEIEQYSENQAIWVELLTLISMLISTNDNYLQVNFQDNIKEINKNIEILDKVLRLKLHLYNKD
ncbi:hypothetical protein [Spiroplasma diminutum]|uniref:Uncharacterized protein n=1 Tax=Spiroplasma diminutum CUAS-1 TaxID=1276221 RepID=S5LWI1_9MOLU|nr:hypothetical protein [Spiroplasma diminutum]AGR42134.1 hypothetical protein SDIMI_v3c04300 [Spiroplasma diminutum CUAS-1]